MTDPDGTAETPVGSSNPNSQRLDDDENLARRLKRTRIAQVAVAVLLVIGIAVAVGFFIGHQSSSTPVAAPPSPSVAPSSVAASPDPSPSSPSPSPSQSPTEEPSPTEAATTAAPVEEPSSEGGDGTNGPTDSQAAFAQLVNSATTSEDPNLGSVGDIAEAGYSVCSELQSGSSISSIEDEYRGQGFSSGLATAFVTGAQKYLC